MKLTQEQREDLATLACDTSGIFESRSFHDRMLMGSERIHSLHLQENRPGNFRVLVVASSSDHSWWTSPKYREHQAPAGADLPVRSIGSHKADPYVWENELLKPDRSGVWVIGWESMRGSIPVADRPDRRKTHAYQVFRAMKDGTIPPWGQTGVWDLLIVEDSRHLSFRHTLQSSVLRSIRSRNKLVLADDVPGRNPENLWVTLNWLWPDKYPSYWKWVDYCFETKKNTTCKHGPRTEVLKEKSPGCIWWDVPCAVRKNR